MEVIPDLAENIIKHEVEEIAKQVYLSKDSADKSEPDKTFMVVLAR